MVLALEKTRPGRRYIMNPTEKLAMAVPVLRGDLMKLCGHLNAVYLVAKNEHKQSPARDALMEHCQEMHAQVKGMCGAYDKWRSLTGALEIEQKVEKPRFYVDEQAGIVHKCHCPVLD